MASRGLAGETMVRTLVKVLERVSLRLDSHFSVSAVIGENSFDYSQLQDSEHQKDLEMALRLFHPEKSIA